MHATIKNKLDAIFNDTKIRTMTRIELLKPIKRNYINKLKYGISYYHPSMTTEEYKLLNTHQYWLHSSIGLYYENYDVAPHLYQIMERNDTKGKIRVSKNQPFSQVMYIIRVDEVHKLGVYCWDLPFKLRIEAVLIWMKYYECDPNDIRTYLDKCLEDFGVGAALFFERILGKEKTNVDNIEIKKLYSNFVNSIEDGERLDNTLGYIYEEHFKYAMNEHLLRNIFHIFDKIGNQREAQACRRGINPMFGSGDCICEYYCDAYFVGHELFNDACKQRAEWAINSATVDQINKARLHEFKTCYEKLLPHIKITNINLLTPELDERILKQLRIDKKLIDDNVKNPKTLLFICKHFPDDSVEYIRSNYAPYIVFSVIANGHLK
jgi:hypothetical protein